MICATEVELRGFVNGKMPTDRIDAIASHLDECERCQDTIVAITDNSDTFVGLIRQTDSEATNVPFDAALKAGLERVIHASDNDASDSHAYDSQQDQDKQIGNAPNQLGPYRLEECLGVGGMGTVYKATHLKLKRAVAVKILPRNRWTNAAAVARFQREMEAIGRMDHPNIVRASDAGEHDELHYLAMDFVDGLNLSELVSRLGVLPVPVACYVIQQAAIGLHYAHANGLVHRDIKPSNIMVAKSGIDGDESDIPNVKVLDLGLALLGTENLQHEDEVTTVGQLMGTLDYMSPEQGLDSHEIDHRADIYSLGATLHKLLTGRAPLAHPNCDTLMKKVTALATQSAPSLATADQSFPQELVSAVDRMLARNPEDRFESAKEVSDALSPLADGTRLNALLTDALQVQTAPINSEFGTGLQMLQPFATQSAPHSATTTAPKSNRNGPLRIAVIALGIVGLFLSGLLYRITTDKGDLIIESDIADVQLEIKRSDRVVKESYEVHTGQQSLRLYSGAYEIKILQPFSGISLSKNQVTLTRDDKKTIKITRVPTAKQNQVANLRDSSLDLTPELHLPIGPDRVYDNRTFDQWYQKGTRETNPSSLTGIGQALVTVADSKDEYQKAMRLMIEIQQRGADDTGFLFAEHARAALMIPADILLYELHRVLGTDQNASTRNFIATLLIGNNNDGLTSKLSASQIPIKLFELAKSSNIENSEWAVSLLQQLIPHRITTTIPGLEPWLTQAIEGSTEANRTYNLCVLLLQLDRRSPAVISGLLKILDDPMSKYAKVHEQAAEVIHAIAPFSDETIKRLCRHLNRFDATYPPSDSTQKVMLRVIRTLRDFGNQATAASPSIRSFLSKKGHRGDVQLLQTEAASVLSSLENQARKPNGPIAVTDRTVAASSMVHKHANEDEQNNCKICQIAGEAVKIAEKQLDSARRLVESGTADASSAHDAMAHLLKTKLRFAKLTGKPFEQQVKIAEEHVKALEKNVDSSAALFETGAATHESILDAQSELMNAQLELELLKSSQSKTEFQGKTGLPSETVPE